MWDKFLLLYKCGLNRYFCLHHGFCCHFCSLLGYGIVYIGLGFSRVGDYTGKFQKSSHTGLYVYFDIFIRNCVQRNFTSAVCPGTHTGFSNIFPMQKFFSSDKFFLIFSWRGKSPMLNFFYTFPTWKNFLQTFSIPLRLWKFSRMLNCFLYFSKLHS